MQRPRRRLQADQVEVHGPVQVPREVEEDPRAQGLPMQERTRCDLRLKKKERNERRKEKAKRRSVQKKVEGKGRERIRISNLSRNTKIP